MIDEKKVIFSKTISKHTSLDDYEDTVSISLTCDDDVNVQMSAPRSIVTYEALSYGPPVVIMTFVDGGGDLVNAKKLDASDIYTFRIGTVNDKILETKLRLSHIEHANTQGGQPHETLFNVHFVHKSWKQFSYVRHNLGWSDETYSDIIEDVMSRTSLNVRDVIASSPTIETTQMPYWTPQRMVEWVCRRASPSSGDGEYEYCINLNNDFFFAPFSSLMNEEVDIREDSGVVLSMGSPQNERGRSGEMNDNSKANFTFLTLDAKEESIRMHKRGAGGVLSHSYDFDNAEPHTERTKYSEIGSSMMSDWSLVLNDDEDCFYRMDLGRNYEEREAITENRILNVVNCMQKVKVSLHGTPVIRPGEVVTLDIPIMDDYSYQGIKNEQYSGKYVVAEVENRVASRKSGHLMRSDLTLIRQGTNTKENNYYV